MIKVYALCTAPTDHHLRGAELLEWAQSTNFCHVALLFMFEKPVILESVSPLSHSVYYEEWLKHYEVKEKYLVGIIDYEPARVFIECMVDIPYAFSQLVLIAIQNLLRKILRTKVKLAENNGDVICTEVYTMFVQVFRQFVFDDNKNLIDLNTALESMKKLALPEGS